MESQVTNRGSNSADRAERIGFYASRFARDARTEDRLRVKIVNRRQRNMAQPKLTFEILLKTFSGIGSGSPMVESSSVKVARLLTTSNWNEWKGE